MLLEDLATEVKPRMASNVLLYAIVGFFIIAFLWATFTELDRTVHGSGRIVPAAKLQVVSNLEGGMIAEVLVKPDQLVQKDAPLLRLDSTVAGAEFDTTRTTTENLKLKIARLSGEITGQRPDLGGSGVSAQQAEIERSLYQARQAGLAGTLAAASARLTEARRAVSEAQANLSAAIASRDSAKQQADMIRPLVLSGIEPRLSLVQAERQAVVSAAQASAASATLGRARAQVAEATATAAQLQQDWRSKSGEELAAAQGELATRSEGLPALADRVRRTVVRAPLAGRVNRIMVSTVGGSVRPGEPLVELVPVEKGLIVETRVRPSDIAFVRTNQRALVKITAYDYSVYGGLEGRVIGISPDATVEERTGESYYVVRVQTNADALIDKQGNRLPIGAGMIADVNLIGDKRSILSYIMTPLTYLSQGAFRER